MFLGVTAGALIGVLADLLPLADFETGIQYDFRPYQVVYSLFKTIVFAFIIVSISAYHGYFTRGGALEVGKSSTQAVVYSIVLIMVANLLITQLILT